jgi:hypothetical protein
VYPRCGVKSQKTEYFLDYTVQTMPTPIKWIKMQILMIDAGCAINGIEYSSLDAKKPGNSIN